MRKLFSFLSGNTIKSFMKSVLYNVAGYLTALLFLITVIWFLTSYLFTFEYNVTVTDKQTTYNKQTKDSDFLVFTDVTTFKLDDTLWGTIRFDSSDEYGLITVGECYKLKAFGYRVPLFTMYPNIIDFTQRECRIAKNENIKALLEQYDIQENEDIKNDIINNLNQSKKSKDNLDRKTLERIKKLENLNWTARV